MVADLTGKTSSRTRDESALWTNLKIYWDAMRIDQTGDARRCASAEPFRLANASLAVIVFGIPEGDAGFDTGEAITKYSWSGAEHDRGRMRARRGIIQRRYGDVEKGLLKNGGRTGLVIFSFGRRIETGFSIERKLKAACLRDGWRGLFLFYADGNLKKAWIFIAATCHFTGGTGAEAWMKPYPYNGRGSLSRKIAEASKIIQLEIQTCATAIGTVAGGFASINYPRKQLMKQCSFLH